MTDLDGIGTLPHGLHGQDAPKYDLKAMRYVPDADNIKDLCLWNATPQGADFWFVQHENGLTDEGRAALAEMKAQWEKENG